MAKIILYLILPLVAALSFPISEKIVVPNAASLAVFPPQVIQGEPMMATISGIKDVSSVKKLTFDDSPLDIFQYNGKPTTLIGIDLNKNPGNYEIKAELADGRVLQKTVVINERKKITAPLGIPQKLGGNTPTSQNLLVATLAAENRSLASLHTGKNSFWIEKFRYPLTKNIITDTFGYLRQTGSYSIAHKGVDFRADEGTPVFATNRGVVRAARVYRNYGKTVVIDHGLGLMTFYMHLSEIKVNEGEMIKSSQLIALSGRTGYAERPHLHFTVKIKGVSVDPIKFFELFNQN